MMNSTKVYHLLRESTGSNRCIEGKSQTKPKTSSKACTVQHHHRVLSTGCTSGTDNVKIKIKRQNLCSRRGLIGG